LQPARRAQLFRRIEKRPAQETRAGRCVLRN
jgi:hypothetical protein